MRFHAFLMRWIAHDAVVQFIGDGGIITRCMLEGLQCQRTSHVDGNMFWAACLAKGVENGIVAFGIGSNEDVLMVFRGSANHCWTANVNHFQQRRVVKRWVLLGSGCKGVEVASDHSDGGVAQPVQFRCVVLLVESGKEGPVNGWVERFDSPVENFWVFGEVRYMEDVKSCFSQCSCSAAC